MAPGLELADWLEELAVFGTPRRFQDAETTHHLSEAIKYLYLVKLATESRAPAGSSAAKARGCHAHPPGSGALAWRWNSSKLTNGV